MSTQKTAVNTVELTVGISADELREATDKVFRRKVKTITVPGFRKGKAPRQIIERMYGEGVFLEDAVNDLYPKAYSDAVDEAKIEPVDRADVEMLSVDKASGVTFKATVTVKPEVTLKNYKGVAVQKNLYPVLDVDIDDEIERMRERNARIVTVEGRAAKTGDEATIDFEGFVDGVAFDGGKSESHKLTLGSHSFIDNFEEQIEGHMPGDEFDVGVTFPEQYHAENLKGKPAVFKVKLTELRERELPELDDEFVKDVSEFDTLDELRADIRSHREESAKARSGDELENAVMDEIIKDMEAEIPDCMVEARIGEMVRDFEYRISQQGMNLDMYLRYTGMEPGAFRESFQEQAARQVKTRLALEKIAELEGFDATRDDIEAEYTKIAEAHKIEIGKIKDIVPEREIIADVKATKAIDFARDNAVVTEKAFEELVDAAGAEKPAKKPAAKKAPAKKTKANDESGPEKPEKKAAAKKPAARKNADAAE